MSIAILNFLNLFIQIFIALVKNCDAFLPGVMHDVRTSIDRIKQNGGGGVLKIFYKNHILFLYLRVDEDSIYLYSPNK